MTLSGRHVNEGIQIAIKNNKAFPIKPFYKKDKNFLYAKDKAAANNFLKKLKKDGVDVSKTQIITDLAGLLEFDFELDNIAFKKGMAKIAVGFATKMGLDLNQLEMVIDIEKNQIKEELAVMPYLPESAEIFLEGKEIDIFPCHTLALHSDLSNSLLFCYVELFSTFKFYVLISQKYCLRELHEFYFYSLTKNLQLSLNEYLEFYPEHLSFFKSLNYNKFFRYKDLTVYNKYITENFEQAQLFGHLGFKKLEKYLFEYSISQKMAIYFEAN